MYCFYKNRCVLISTLNLDPENLNRFISFSKILSKVKTHMFFNVENNSASRFWLSIFEFRFIAIILYIFELSFTILSHISLNETISNLCLFIMYETCPTMIVDPVYSDEPRICNNGVSWVRLYVYFGILWFRICLNRWVYRVNVSHFIRR